MANRIVLSSRNLTSNFSKILEVQKKNVILGNSQRAATHSYTEEKTKENSNHDRFKLHGRAFSSAILFALGCGVGGVGFTLYNYIENKRKNIFSILPSSLFPVVSAASPLFGNRNPSDIRNDVPRKGNRHAYNFIADVVEKVSDGVVYIDIKDPRRRDYKGKTMSISNGSGFVVESSGLILTNAHVVANKPRASTIVVRLSDGNEYEGKIEELDAISDLALVRINVKGLKPLVMGSSKEVRPGEFVVALGSPLALSNTITSGVVSSVGRASKDLGLRGRDLDYIQTDAAITFGNSGGPLVNLDGEVIGINSMKVTSGISFAIPVDYAKGFLAKADKKRSFISKHKSDEGEAPKRRYLGITMLSLTPEIIVQMQQKSPGSLATELPDNLTHGILVWRIVVGSPAYHAGLEPGDIVTHINGHEIHSSKDVYAMLEKKSDLSMVVVRKGQRYSVTVTPEE